MPIAEVIYTIQSIPSSTTKDYGRLLNRFLGIIKLIHWYANDWTLHQITNTLYIELTELFDSFQEELVIVSNNSLPAIPDNKQWSDFSDKADVVNLIDNIQVLLSIFQETKLKEVVVNYHNSGLVNALESILTALNKALYQAAMIN